MRQRMGEGVLRRAGDSGLTQYLMVRPSGNVSSPHLVAKQEGEGALLARGLTP